MTYRFLGAHAEIGGQVAERFGQPIDMPEDLYLEIRHKIPLLPEEDFAALGFSEGELQKYSLPRTWATAPQEFQDKKEAAVSLWYQNRFTPAQVEDYAAKEEVNAD